MSKIIRLAITVLLLVCVFSLSFAQSEFGMDAKLRLESWKEHKKMEEGTLFKNLEWRNVGPLVQGGRITDFAIPPGDHFKIFAAAASGGLWFTYNNGTTWKPIFDNQSSITIGDIAVDPKNIDVIWVGTGENNSSRSSYAGTGVFKSTDGGKTWKNLGLYDSHHIGRIIIDPENSDIVYIASIGHLYTKNEERGVYKTTDGGKSWEKILYIDENTGVIDLVMDPEDNKTLYAAAWERSRKAWNFEEGGKGSGIYKTTDAGKNWIKLTNGFPENDNVGRIGLAVSHTNPNMVYALLDNQNPRPKKPAEDKEKPKSGITIEMVREMTKDDFLNIDNKKLNIFLRENNIPKRFTAEIVKTYVKKGKITVRQIADYLVDENERLFRTNVIGAEVYLSLDKGKSWKKMNKDFIDDFYHSYGYYFGEIRIDPENSGRIYILGVPIMVSTDSGKTYKYIRYRGLHGDHQAMWIDPRNPDRIVDGNDGGINFSYDAGETWRKINNIPLAQFYTINVDMEKPYNIYGGTQDNGTLYGPVTTRPGISAPWKWVNGGDGGFVHIDPVETDIVYSEAQFGYISRINKKTGDRKSIRPQAEFGEPPLRFNWLTPFIISPHNRYILYLGTQKLFKSLDKGDTWHAISPDLTTDNARGRKGDVPYSTITALDESPIKPGLLYVGTDDSKVWVSKNGGADWIEIDEDLPEKWVTRIVASKFDEATVYVTLTGYREDDFRTYVYKSIDYGKNWKSIKANLPEEPVNVIREDPENENILYLGTDLSCYVTLNGGKQWYILNSKLPTNAVYDAVVHHREGDLVIGTHGRGAFVMNLKWIRQLDEEILASDAHFFDIESTRLIKRYGSIFGEAEFVYFLKDNDYKNVEIQIYNEKGKKKIHTLKGGNDRGYNFVTWDLKIKKDEFIDPGKYKVILKADKIKLEKILEILPDNNPEDDVWDFNSEE